MAVDLLSFNEWPHDECKVKFHDTFIMYNFVFIVMNSLYSKTKAFQKHEYSCHNFLSPRKENVSEREREKGGDGGKTIELSTK
jgi:hypothetical protein